MKRRISVRSLAERLAVSEGTVIRPTKGDAGESMGTLAMALDAFANEQSSIAAG